MPTVYLATIIASLFASAKDICSKSLSAKISPDTSAFFSLALALPFYLCVLIYLATCGVHVFALGLTFFFYVLLRALSDTAAEWCKMKSFAHGDISLVTGYMSLSPIFLLIISPIITGDIPSLYGIVGVLITTFGIFILTGVSLQLVEARKGIFFAILTAIFFSINNCFDRLATQLANPFVSGFWMTLVAALMLLPLYIKDQKRSKKTSPLPWKLLLTRGVCETLFMSSKLWALQYLQAPYVASILKLSLILTIFSGGFLFKEKDFQRRAIGGIFIITGSIIVIIGSYLQSN